MAFSAKERAAIIDGYARKFMQTFQNKSSKYKYGKVGEFIKDAQQSHGWLTRHQINARMRKIQIERGKYSFRLLYNLCKDSIVECSTAYWLYCLCSAEHANLETTQTVLQLAIQILNSVRRFDELTLCSPRT